MRNRVLLASCFITVLLGAAAFFQVAASSEDQQAPPVDYQAGYGVSPACAAQLARIERLADQGRWGDSYGPWAIVYRQFPPSSLDRDVTLLFISDQAIDFWPDGSKGPSSAQCALLEPVVLEMVGDPTLSDQGIWSAAELANVIGIVHRADVSLLIAGHVQDAETRAWTSHGEGRW